MKFKLSNFLLAVLFLSTFNVYAEIYCPSGSTGAGNCKGCSGGENSCVAAGSVCCYSSTECYGKPFCWNGSTVDCHGL